MMTKPHSITQIRPWPSTNSLAAHLHELFAHLKSVLQIPTGYQDETGFHLGAEPVSKEMLWPSA
jgi:hypothetical protein